MIKSELCLFVANNVERKFCSVAGDHDAILVLLFVPRMIAKCDVLMTQVREKVRGSVCLPRRWNTHTQ